MKKNELADKFLKIFNRNIPLDETFSIEEIKDAFERRTYYTDKSRITKIYDLFFENFTPKQRDEFCNTFEINKRDIKKVYESSPFIKIAKIAKKWDALYRIPMEDRIYTKIKQINENITAPFIERNNHKYTNLDKFEIYELTPCIAYEMAIRNDEVKKTLDRLKLIDEMMYIPENKDKKALKYDYAFKTYYSENKFNNLKNTNLLPTDYQNFTFKEYERYIISERYKYTSMIEQDYKKFIDKDIFECIELEISHLENLKKKIENELINEHLIYPDKFYRKIQGGSYRYESIQSRNKTKNRRKKVYDEGALKLEKTIQKGFVQIQGFDRETNEYYVNSIIPNFHRQVNDENKISIPINIDLPINEIVEYIKIIKENAIIKSPIEIISNKLNKAAGDLSYMNVIDENAKRTTRNMTLGEKPQFNLINMLYIYDMLKCGHTVEEIKKSIYDYEGELNKKNRNKIFFKLDDIRTIKSYNDIAVEYIDNEKYKELITGKIEKN